MIQKKLPMHDSWAPEASLEPHDYDAGAMSSRTSALRLPSVCACIYQQGFRLGGRVREEGGGVVPAWNPCYIYLSTDLLSLQHNTQYK